MKGLIAFMGATLAGSLGWWLGARVGMMTAFVVSTVGTGVGAYYTRRWVREHLP